MTTFMVATRKMFLLNCTTKMNKMVVRRTNFAMTTYTNWMDENIRNYVEGGANIRTQKFLFLKSEKRLQ